MFSWLRFFQNSADTDTSPSQLPAISVQSCSDDDSSSPATSAHHQAHKLDFPEELVSCDVGKAKLEFDQRIFMEDLDQLRLAQNLLHEDEQTLSTAKENLKQAEKDFEVATATLAKDREEFISFRKAQTSQFKAEQARLRQEKEDADAQSKHQQSQLDHDRLQIVLQQIALTAQEKQVQEKANSEAAELARQRVEFQQEKTDFTNQNSARNLALRNQIQQVLNQLGQRTANMEHSIAMLTVPASSMANQQQWAEVATQHNDRLNAARYWGNVEYFRQRLIEVARAELSRATRNAQEALQAALQALQ